MSGLVHGSILDVIYAQNVHMEVLRRNQNQEPESGPESGTGFNTQLRLQCLGFRNSTRKSTIKAPISHHLRTHKAMNASTPPQEDEISPQIKAEFEEWGTKTTGGVLAGMLYGGAREAASAAKTEQSRLPFPHEDKMKPKGKIIREMTENKVLRIARGTVLGGAKLGAFVALFSGVQHGLAVHRSAHDALNTVAAGAITGGSFSLTLPGSLVTRISSAAMGTILGGSVALPLGWLQSTLQAELNPVQEQEAPEPKVKYEEGQRIDAVIRRLESRSHE